MNPILNDDLNRIIAQDISWEKLRDKRIMVTGASGMLGTYFVRTVLKLNEAKNANINVLCIVRNPKKIPSDIANNERVEIVSQQADEY